VLAYGQSGDRCVEGIFGTSGPLQKVPRLFGEALDQIERAKACDLLAQFDDWRVEWIPRKENRRADELGRT